MNRSVLEVNQKFKKNAVRKEIIKLKNKTPRKYPSTTPAKENVSEINVN